MAMLRCDNPVRSCGVVEHDVGSYYWVCSVCGSCGERLRRVKGVSETLT